jgi:hemerythrin superfamily protein
VTSTDSAVGEEDPGAALDVTGVTGVPGPDRGGTSLAGSGHAAPTTTPRAPPTHRPTPEATMTTASLAARLSPSATKMIRLDHSHVAITSHQYTADTSPQRKGAIGRTVCLALEIHAQLEEEIFYPAMQEVDPGNPVLANAAAEHDEMRRLIAELRSLDPADARHAEVFAALMRAVLHHVADEETLLLPAAERSMTSERLGELGARMTRRRLELAGPHAGEITVDAVRALPRGTVIAGTVLVFAAFLLGRGSAPRGSHAA